MGKRKITPRQYEAVLLFQEVSNGKKRLIVGGASKTPSSKDKYFSSSAFERIINAQDAGDPFLQRVKAVSTFLRGAKPMDSITIGVEDELLLSLMAPSLLSKHEYKTAQTAIKEFNDLTNTFKSFSLVQRNIDRCLRNLAEKAMEQRLNNTLGPQGGTKGFVNGGPSQKR